MDRAVTTTPARQNAVGAMEQEKRDIVTKKSKRWAKKLNGLSNKNYCQACLSYNCYPMDGEDSIANKKRRYRRKMGLCEGCGKLSCSCKNKGPWDGR